MVSLVYVCKQSCVAFRLQVFHRNSTIFRRLVHSPSRNR